MSYILLYKKYTQSNNNRAMTEARNNVKMSKKRYNELVTALHDIVGDE